MIALLFGADNILTAGQMAVRAALVFVLTLVLIRVSGRRSVGQRTPFDAATTVLLGAILSRGVVGASSFGATVAAAVVLVLLHRVVGWASVRWDGFDVWVNGRDRVVVSEGKRHPQELARALITQRDLVEAIRKKLGRVDWSHVEGATLERDGEMSISRASSK